MWRNLYYLYLLMALNGYHKFSVSSISLLSFETLLTYYYDYYAFIGEGDKRFQEYQDNRVRICSTALGGGGVILYVTYTHGLLSVTFLIWMSLVVPYRWLKKIPLLKSVIIGALWTLNGITFNRMIVDESDFCRALEESWAESVVLFTFMNVVSIFNDLKDLEEDRVNHVFTIPVLIDTWRTRVLLTFVQVVLLIYSSQHRFYGSITVYSSVLLVMMWTKNYSTAYYKTTVLFLVAVGSLSLCYGDKKPPFSLTT